MIIRRVHDFALAGLVLLAFAVWLLKPRVVPVETSTNVCEPIGLAMKQPADSLVGGYDWPLLDRLQPSTSGYGVDEEAPPPRCRGKRCDR